MRCTNCQAESTRTYDVRQHEDVFPYAVRIRKCMSCGHQYRSIEVPLTIFEDSQEKENDTEISDDNDFDGSSPTDSGDDDSGDRDL